MRLLRTPSALGAVALAALGWAGLLAVMPAAMVWLCAAGGLSPSVEQWDVARLLALMPMWCAMPLAMALPCLLIAGAFAPSRRLPRVYPGAFLLLGVAGAVSHWTLESAALLESNATRFVLLSAVLALEVRKWRSRASHLAPALQMICLQLLWPTSLHWMLVVMLWMVADALMPKRPFILAATRHPVG